MNLKNSDMFAFYQDSSSIGDQTLEDSRYITLSSRNLLTGWLVAAIYIVLTTKLPWLRSIPGGITVCRCC